MFWLLHFPLSTFIPSSIRGKVNHVGLYVSHTCNIHHWSVWEIVVEFDFKQVTHLSAISHWQTQLKPGKVFVMMFVDHFYFINLNKDTYQAKTWNCDIIEKTQRGVCNYIISATHNAARSMSTGTKGTPWAFTKLLDPPLQPQWSSQPSKTSTIIPAPKKSIIQND